MAYIRGFMVHFSQTSFLCFSGRATHVQGSPGYIPTVFQGANRAKGKKSPKKRVTKTSARTPVTPVTSPSFSTPKSATSRKRQPKKRAVTTDPPSTPSGRPQISKRFCRDRLYQHVPPSEDHDYERTTRLHYVQTEVEHYKTLLEVEREAHEKHIKRLESKIISLNTVTDFRLWTNFPNRDVFNALCKYLKKRGGEKLKYWRGGATAQSEYHGDKNMRKPGPNRKLSFEEELFMVCVKLKSGLNNTELSQLFGISDTVVSQVFTTLINFLCQELKVLFHMPPLDVEGVAQCFKQWENLMVVLDCTELTSEKSSNLTARKQMFSNYKGRDTVKFAVSLGPNLCVNYVSKAYGGRASDKFITMNSQDLLDALPPGSKVMTDRGFNVGDELNEMGVELIIPTFKGRGRTQMTKSELDSSENIAMARIYVERIIQRIRTYQILEKAVKLSSKDLIEQIFTVCAYLTNLQLPIIQEK